MAGSVELWSSGAGGGCRANVFQGLYPRPLRAWVVPQDSSTTPKDGAELREWALKVGLVRRIRGPEIGPLRGELHSGAQGNFAQLLRQDETQATCLDASASSSAHCRSAYGRTMRSCYRCDALSSSQSALLGRSR